jgi:hypothetical protein
LENLQDTAAEFPSKKTAHDDFDWSISKKNVTSYDEATKKEYDAMYSNSITTITTPANRVTDPEADSVGLGSGAESRTLNQSQIPDHKHDMIGNDENQYYAFRNIPGAPTDTDAISGEGSNITERGQYLLNSGGVLDYTAQTALNVMNPYLAVNYIIYTGQN